MAVGTKTTETKWWTWICPVCGKEQRRDASCNLLPVGNEVCFACECNARKERAVALLRFLDGSEVVEVGVGEHSTDNLDRIRLRTKDGRLFDVTPGSGECPDLDVDEVKP